MLLQEVEDGDEDCASREAGEDQAAGFVKAGESEGPVVQPEQEVQRQADRHEPGQGDPELGEISGRYGALEAEEEGEEESHGDQRGVQKQERRVTSPSGNPTKLGHEEAQTVRPTSSRRASRGC